MDEFELFNEGMNFYKGQNGYPQNSKKAIHYFEKSSEAGNRDASFELAKLYFLNKNYDLALKYFDTNEAYLYGPRQYVFSILKQLPRNVKKNPDLAETMLNKAIKCEKSLDEDGCYYLACIIKAVHPEDEKEYLKYILRAAKGFSTVMPDELYKLVGREYGVLNNLEEMKLFLESEDEDDLEVNGFGPLNKNHDEAWRTAVANLTEKGIKHNISNALIKKLIEAQPSGILEYQPIYEISYYVGGLKGKFKYDNPNYTSVSTGSGGLYVNASWSRIYATYLDKYTQKKFKQKAMSIKYTNTYYNARYRIYPEFGLGIEKILDEDVKDVAKTNAGYKFEDKIANDYNWETKYIDVTIDDIEITPSKKCCYFIPFWFFTIELGKNKSATVRVNASTGEVDTFLNNPFGQFTEYDNPIEGAMMKWNKDIIKDMNKKKRKEKIKKFKWLIIHGAATLLFFLISWPIGLVLLLTFGFHIYMKFFRK